MNSEFLRTLLRLDHAECQEVIHSLSPIERHTIRHHWKLWARPEQLAPEGDWHSWLICAGRGFGKTRSGAEWVRQMVKHRPEARIALVGSSLAEVRAVMVEGESGVLAVCPPDRMPIYEPSLRRLQWPNGAQAFLYSAAEPESLRGPQHHAAWCGEIAKWEQASDRAMRAWSNLLMGLRLDERPRVLATTTPRAVPLVQSLLTGKGSASVVVTRGSTQDNADNLPERFIEDMERLYADTTLGRQELGGELITDIEGSLWTRSLLEQCRGTIADDPLARVVVGVDPPASANGDACGIVVCGVGESAVAQVLADCSVPKPSPERWARAVAEAAQIWNADRVVAEANQGGQMVASVLRAADISLPLKLVHASRGKVARAEPIAALYEAGRVRHTGMFAALEDQLCGLMAGGGYEGPGRSPDRADALVWALTELMLGRSARPRVRTV